MRSTSFQSSFTSKISFITAIACALIVALSLVYHFVLA